jgi:hypothetical protein
VAGAASTSQQPLKRASLSTTFTRIKDDILTHPLPRSTPLEVEVEVLGEVELGGHQDPLREKVLNDCMLALRSDAHGN